MISSMVSSCAIAGGAEPSATATPDEIALTLNILLAIGYFPRT